MSLILGVTVLIIFEFVYVHSDCSYMGYGGNDVHYYPINQCWTNYYDSKSPQLSSSNIWRCNQDGTNITLYYYGTSYDCSGDNAKAMITYPTPKNSNCSGDNCSIIIRRYNLREIDHTIYTEYPYVSSTCFYNVWPGASGYWKCDKFAVFEYFWYDSSECDFANTSSYKVYTTHLTNNISIVECNMSPLKS